MNNFRRSFRFCFFFFLCLFLFDLTQSDSVASTSQQTDNVKARILAEIEQLKQAALNSSDAHLHYKLGDLYNSLGRWQEASESLERATQLRPNFLIAFYELGWCYAGYGKYTEALNAHQQTLALLIKGAPTFKLDYGKMLALPLLSEPTTVEAQFAVGWDYFLMKRYDEAIAIYQKTLELDPKFENALYEIGRVYIAQGKNEEVREIAAKLQAPLNEWLLKELSLAPPPAKPAANKQTVSAAEPVQAQQQTTSVAPARTDEAKPLAMSASLRPKILHRERARYTEEARANRIRGTIVLSVVYSADGHIGSVRVIRGLPYGLTATALVATEKIRFEPAQKDGQPVSVRGNIEFDFTLY